jgi:hypothetical protein
MECAGFGRTLVGQNLELFLTLNSLLIRDSSGRAERKEF